MFGWAIAALAAGRPAHPPVDFTGAEDRWVGPVQLRPGRTPGTWRLQYVDRLRWRGTPATSTVRLSNGFQTLTTVVVGPGEAVDLDIDVPPGTWHVDADVDEAVAGDWWNALGPRLVVDTAGLVTCAQNCRGLRHERKLEGLVPGSGETVSDARPTLTWPAVPGAATYAVRWSEIDPAHPKYQSNANFPVPDRSWTFPTDVVAGRRYHWDVDARDADGVLLARGGAIFYTPGYVAPPPDPPLPPGRIGAELRPSAGPGVLVGAVDPRSPAAAVGLRTGDRIVGAAGGPVSARADVMAAVGRTAIGEALALEVVRADGTQVTLRPIVEPRTESDPGPDPAQR
jgi:hypothetical protein